MKKILSTILLLIVSTIFLGSLLSVSAMPHDMPMRDCPISRLGGSSQCFFNMFDGLLAILQHIFTISHSFLGVVQPDIFSFSAFCLAGLIILAVWYFQKKILLRLFWQINRLKFNHQRCHRSSLTPKFLLNWLNQKIRGQIAPLYIRAYNRT